MYRMSLLKRALQSVVLLLLCTTAWAAIHADQAGKTDWHKALVGTPKFVFYTRRTRPEIFVGTESNVIAHLNPKTGDYVWRQVLEPADDLLALKLWPQGLLSLSGRSTKHVRLWDAGTGSLVWDRILESSGSDATAADVGSVDGDVIALFGGDQLVRLDGEEGNVIWSIKQEPGTVYQRLHVHGRSMYVIGAKRAPDSCEISILEIDPADGRILADYMPPNNGVKCSENLFVSSDADQAFLYWNGIARAYRHHLGRPAEAEEVEEVFGVEGARVDGILHSGSLHPELVLRQKAHSAIVRNPHSVLYTFDEAPRDRYSIFAGAQSVGVSYVMRIRGGERMGVATVDFVDITAVKHVGTYTISYDEYASGPIRKAYVDVFPAKDGSLGFRILALTADGSIKLLKDGKTIWTKEESLTHRPAAEFVDLPEKSLLSQEHDELDEQPMETASMSSLARYIRRMRNHLNKFQALPAQLMAWSIGPRAKEAAGEDLDLYTDMLGARKLVVFATRTGKVLALDTEKGRVVWGRYFEGISFQQIESLRASLIKFPPVIALIGKQDHDENITVVHRLNVLTGEDYEGEGLPSAIAAFRSVQTVVKLPIEESDDRTHLLAIVTEDLKVHILPSTTASLTAFKKFLPSFNLYLSEGVLSSTMTGYMVIETNNGDFALHPTWDIQFPDGESLVAIGSGPSHNKVASMGRVLGNRSVLYKYLNPNLVALATLKTTGSDPMAPDFTSVVTIYVIDAATGTVYYSAEFNGAGNASPDIPSIFVLQDENWAILSFWNHGTEAAPSQADAHAQEADKQSKKTRRRKQKKDVLDRVTIPDAKSFEMIVVEFYESAKPDTRIESNQFSSFHLKRPHVVAQSYAVPKRIRAIGSTVTGAGITTKEVLLGLEEGHLYGINKRLLDPRRPTGSLSADDKEEGLIPYRPTLDFNAKEVATYHLHVPRIEFIKSAPTKLESTSLIIAWGLDVFCSRRNPSKSFDVLSESFNYAALIATIASLTVGIWVAKHMAERKKLNDLWN